MFDCKETGKKREFNIVKLLDVLPIIGANARIRNQKKLYPPFKTCLKNWAQEITEEEQKEEKAEEEEEEEEEAEEEEEKAESLLKKVAYNILYGTDSESKNPEQVKQIFSP